MLWLACNPKRGSVHSPEVFASPEREDGHLRTMGVSVFSLVFSATLPALLNSLLPVRRRPRNAPCPKGHS